MAENQKLCIRAPSINIHSVEGAAKPEAADLHLQVCRQQRRLDLGGRAGEAQLQQRELLAQRRVLQQVPILACTAALVWLRLS